MLIQFVLVMNKRRLWRPFAASDPFARKPNRKLDFEKLGYYIDPGVELLV